jgi:hypothetical protein
MRNLDAANARHDPEYLRVRCAARDLVAVIRVLRRETSTTEHGHAAQIREYQSDSSSKRPAHRRIQTLRSKPGSNHPPPQG